MLIFLIGYMGSGKSTFGKKLSKEIGFEFIDTDIEIKNIFNKSINEIFELYGENKFREEESKLISKLNSENNIVVACGGGLVCFNDNIDKLNLIGETIYLKMNSSALYSRLVKSKQNRPLLKSLTDYELEKFIEKSLKEREKFYNKCKYNIEGLSLRIQDVRVMLNV